MKQQHATHSDHPCRQPAAAGRSAGDDPGEAARASRSTQAACAPRQERGRRGRAQAGRSRHRHRRRWRDGAVRLYPLCQRASRRHRAERKSARAAPTTGASRANTWRFPNLRHGPRRCRAAAGQDRPHALGVHRPDLLQGPGRAAARHRQSEGGARRGRLRGSLHAGGVAGQPRQLEPQRVLQDRGRIPLRARRGAARGIPGDHRCRPRPADRRPAAGAPIT